MDGGELTREGAVLVACCHLSLTIGELAPGRIIVSGAIREAAGRGAQIVVVPELR